MSQRLTDFSDTYYLIEKIAVDHIATLRWIQRQAQQAGMMNSIDGRTWQSAWPKHLQINAGAADTIHSTPSARTAASALSAASQIRR